MLKYAHKTNPGARWVSWGPHVGPSGDGPGYVSPMARSYFCKRDWANNSASPLFLLPRRLRPFRPRPSPPKISPRCLHPPAPDCRRRLALAPSAKTHSHTALCQVAASADSRAPRSVSQLDWPGLAQEHGERRRRTRPR